MLDEESGSIYYRNNVSGDTQWEMPSDLDHLVSYFFINNNIFVIFFNFREVLFH